MSDNLREAVEALANETTPEMEALAEKGKHHALWVNLRQDLRAALAAHPEPSAHLYRPEWCGWCDERLADAPGDQCRRPQNHAEPNGCLDCGRTDGGCDRVVEVASQGFGHSDNGLREAIEEAIFEAIPSWEDARGGVNLKEIADAVLAVLAGREVGK